MCLLGRETNRAACRKEKYIVHVGCVEKSRMTAYLTVMRRGCAMNLQVDRSEIT